MAKEKWSKGRQSDTVVSDTPNGIITDREDAQYENDSRDYYGGYLIAESIPKQEYVNLIGAAPSMLALLEKALPIIEKEAEQREEAPDFYGKKHPYWSEMRELSHEIAVEIDKAYGREAQDDRHQ